MLWYTKDLHLKPIDLENIPKWYGEMIIAKNNMEVERIKAESGLR